MAVTENLHTGNGSKTNYSFTFPYLKTTDIKVSVNGSVVTNFTAGSPTATEIQFNTAPANNDAIRIYRDTSTDNLSATFYAGSAIKSEDLNDNFLQNLYVTQEAKRDADAAWQDGDETINSSETWHTTDDTKVATTKAIENRIDAKIDTALTTDVVGGTAITVTDDSPSTGKITLAVTAGGIDTTQLAADAVDGTKIANDSINSEHYVAGSIDTEHIADGQVTHDKLGTDCIDGDNIQNDVINSEHYVAGSIDEEHIATGAVTHNKLGSDCIDGDNIQNDVINSEHYAAGSIDHEHLANDIIDGDNIQNDAVNSEHIATGAIDLEHMSINSVDSDQYVDGSIDRVHLSADIIDATKIEDDAVTTDHIQDAELVTLAGMPSATASRLADSTALTATTSELNILDNKTFKDSSAGTLNTTSDTEIPSSKVIAAHVASSQTAIGGFVTIADEVSFPTTANMPANGVVVSINNAAGVVVNGSGVSTTGRTTDGTPATVTINNFPSSLNGETLAAGVGLMVTATSTANTYNYHKILAAETDVKQLSDDINDFNARYRVASSAPSSNNDDGDLYFDTGANKMKVYNATTSTWDDVASVGNFYINTLSSSSGTGGGGATFGSGRYRFTLSNPPTMAQQLIVSVNGVIQKPNAGSSQPSEGFAIDGSDIIFSAAPAANSDYFIVTQGSSVSIGTPSDNTVSTAKIQNQAVNSAKIQDASIVNGDIADDTIAEVKLDIHNTPATGKYLKYTSNGMEWSDGASEGSDVKSTGITGTDKYLRADGDGTASWIAAPFLPLAGGVVSGDTIISGTNVEVRLNDGVKADFGTGSDTSVYFDGTDTQIKSQSGKIVVSTTANNDDIEITPHGSGNIKLDGLDWPNADGSADQILKTDGSGALGWTTISAAPEVKLTASEAITAEDPIMVKTNGQAEKITGVNSGMSSEHTINNSAKASGNICYDKNADKWIALYYDNQNSMNLYGRIGTKSGNTITWGDNQLIQSNGGGTDEVENHIGMAYFASRSRVVYGYRGGSNSQAQIGFLDINGTTLSKSYGGSWNNNTKSPRFATGGGKDVYVWWDGNNSNKGKVTVLSYPNASSVSDQSSFHIDNNHQNSTNPDIAFGNNCFLIVFNGNTGHPFARTMSTSPAMAVASTELASWDLPNENGPKVTYASGSSVFVVCYPIHNSHFYGQVVTASTSSITYGTPFIISDNYNCRKAQNYDVEYNATANKVIFTYVKNGSSGGKYRLATITGTGSSATCTLDTEQDLLGTSRESQYVHVANNDEDNVFGIITNSNTGWNTAYGRVYTPSNTNMDPNRFVGFAKSSVSSGAEVTVKVNSNTSTQSGLTAGSVYYLQGDGSLGTSPSGDGTLKAGLALSSTKLLIKD